MTQVRLSVEKFARDIDAALAGLAPGDEVLLERSGHIVARVKAEPAATDWKAFLAKLDQPRALLRIPLAGSKVRTWRMPVPGEAYTGIWHKRYYVPGSNMATKAEND